MSASSSSGSVAISIQHPYFGFFDFVNQDLERRLPLTDAQKTVLTRYFKPRSPPTDAQLRVLSEFEALVKDEMGPEEDQVFLVRFLIARKWNVEEATTMYRSSKEWKATTFPLVIPSEVFFRMLHFRVMEIFPRARDRFNQPLIVMTPHRYNPDINNRELELMTKGVVWGMELITSIVRRPFDKFVFIVDMTNWGLRNADMKLMSKLFNTIQPNYPDYMGSTYIVNAPWILTGIWKLLEVMLDEHTKSKIAFLKPNEAKELFGALFDPADLYERIGGTKVEVNPTSKGEWEPEDIKEWKTACSGTAEERSDFFDRRLATFLEGLAEPEKTFWTGAQNSANLTTLSSQYLEGTLDPSSSSSSSSAPSSD